MFDTTESVVTGTLLITDSSSHSNTLRFVRISLGIFSLLVNAFAFTSAIAQRSTKHKLIKILILNQNIADFTCAVGVLLSQLAGIIHDFHLDWNRDRLTIGVYGLIIVSFTVSLANALLIGFERFIATSQPSVYKKTCTKRRLVICAGSVWIITLAVVLSPLIAHFYGEDSNINGDRFYILQMQNNLPNMLAKLIPIVYTLLMLGNCVLYLKIFLCFKRSRNRVNVSAGEKSSRKMTVTVVTVMAATLICYTPTVVYFLAPPNRGNPHISLTFSNESSSTRKRNTVSVKLQVCFVF
ncbi:hypothetical protein CAPTEDRAFT_215639 [Capitella teleta]|uniref:G-protein coupled receptors family 1 profile domain-containing protein n=1 Tax=Capitella teleta TaxID=283909 RepID=R7T6H0_CAPTE|nr:hypothetical protein CAPTEDRAFT_215639 [Capitella teleta]|eukprot:ELT88933.1 hypothetical protein CAPTEDRAFT_215639 [Capitella teleta]